MADVKGQRKMTSKDGLIHLEKIFEPDYVGSDRIHRWHLLQMVVGVYPATWGPGPIHARPERLGRLDLGQNHFLVVSLLQIPGSIGWDPPRLSPLSQFVGRDTWQI